MTADKDRITVSKDNAQVVNSESVGYVDEFGNFEFAFPRPRLRPNVIWTPLYTTPQPAPDTVPRAEYNKLLEALRVADEFISNGIEMGYITMPKKETNDRASKTPSIVRQAIAEAEGK